MNSSTDLNLTPCKGLTNAIETLRCTVEFLRRNGFENPEQEGMAFVLGFLGIDSAALFTNDPEVAEADMRALHVALARRAHHEPLQYILGKVAFDSIEIKVGPGALVPRPETEILVDEFKYRYPDFNEPLRVLDLCTGSGCIALSLASVYSNSDFVGSDISTDALSYAVANAGELGLENVEFILGNLFEEVLGRFDVIVCNPPYIRTVDIEGLSPEIRNHEPRMALDGGEDGLDFYRRIILDVPKYLRTGGMLFMELGAGQADTVKGICEHADLEIITVVSDLAGHGRVLVARNGIPKQ